MATKTEKLRPLSQKKALPLKPKDVIKKPVIPVVTDWLKNVPSQQMIHKSNTHTTHILPPSPNLSHSGHRLLKKYFISSPNEYIQFENLLAALLNLLSPMAELKNCPRLLLPTDYTCNENDFVLIRPHAQSTLEQQLTTLGYKRTFTVDDAWSILSDMTEAVRDLNEVGMAHLDIKPENILLCPDKGYRLADVIFNEYVVGTIKEEENKKKTELMQVFPHMGNKTEHTVVIFNKAGNEYINARNVNIRAERQNQPVLRGKTGGFDVVQSSHILKSCQTHNSVDRSKLEVIQSIYRSRTSSSQMPPHDTF